MSATSSSCERHGATVIEACRYVDEVVADAPCRLTKDFLDQHGITAVVHGDDLAPAAAED